jgi:CO/xanthine dehydrogenase Mo-binding subunit
MGACVKKPSSTCENNIYKYKKAEALEGVKSVITSKDIVDFPLDKPVILGIQDMRWMCRNVMARDKVLFHGHPLAAVACNY